VRDGKELRRELSERMDVCVCVCVCVCAADTSSVLSTSETAVVEHRRVKISQSDLAIVCEHVNREAFSKEFCARCVQRSLELSACVRV